MESCVRREIARWGDLVHNKHGQLHREATTKAPSLVLTSISGNPHSLLTLISISVFFSLCSSIPKALNHSQDCTTGYSPS